MGKFYCHCIQVYGSRIRERMRNQVAFLGSHEQSEKVGVYRMAYMGTI